MDHINVRNVEKHSVDSVHFEYIQEPALKGNCIIVNFVVKPPVGWSPFKYMKEITVKPGMVIHTCNFSTWEDEAEGS
jgi:hypothetical protein